LVLRRFTVYLDSPETPCLEQVYSARPVLSMFHVSV
jgi:hypothetical protein